MKGIDCSRTFFEKYGKPMIERDFPEYSGRIAAGLVGHGSECFGYDDELSRDHDFDVGFCIWITEEDERKIGFKLFRAYSKLCKEFGESNISQKSLLGSNQKGVRTISEFYSQYTGFSGAPESVEAWLYTPSHYFAEAVNGEVFYDPLGKFSEIRAQIKHGMPEDVRLKKIASSALYMAQTGQYNYKRCIKHKEMAAAQIALADFIKHGVEMAFLLDRAHMPYYKWMFRAMHELPTHGKNAILLENIITEDPQKTDLIEQQIEIYCKYVISALQEEGISTTDSDYLEPHAFSVNDKIKDGKIRNLPVYL